MKARRLLAELLRRRALRRASRILPRYDWGDEVPRAVWERETGTFYLWIGGPTGRS